MTKWDISEIKLFYSLCGKKCDVIQDVVAVSLGNRQVFVDLKDKASLEEVKKLVPEEGLQQDLEDMFFLYELFAEYDFLQKYTCLLIPYYEDGFYQTNMEMLQEVCERISKQSEEQGYVWGEPVHLCMQIAYIKILAKMNDYSRMWKKPFVYAPVDLFTLIGVIDRNVDNFVHDEIAMVQIGIMWRDLGQVKQAYDNCFTIRNDYMSEYGRAYVLQYGYSNYEKAAARYNHCIRLKKYFKAYCHLGDCYIKLGDWQKASESFEQAYDAMAKEAEQETIELDDYLMVFYRCYTAGTIYMRRIVNSPKAFEMYQKTEMLLANLMDFAVHMYHKEGPKVKKDILKTLNVDVMYQNMYSLSQKLGNGKQEHYYKLWKETSGE